MLRPLSNPERVLFLVDQVPRAARFLPWALESSPFRALSLVFKAFGFEPVCKK